MLWSAIGRDLQLQGLLIGSYTSLSSHDIKPSNAYELMRETRLHAIGPTGSAGVTSQFGSGNYVKCLLQWFSIEQARQVRRLCAPSLAFAPDML